MVSIKEIPSEELLAPGHRMCAGCGAAMAARMAMKATRGPTVVVNATCCLEVATTVYPFTSWRVPWIHVAFENSAAVASGIEAAYQHFKKKKGSAKPDVIVFAGDGGTFDIGLQALSGALERGHDFVYICYDNEAYMNTGIQRSGATPVGAATTTSPGGTVIPGKLEWKKDIVAIASAHDIPYAATASVAYWNDYITKVRKAIEANGPAFIHVLAPCPRGWRSEISQTVRVARLAVQTRFFPVYEVERSRTTINIKVPKPIPVEEYLKLQGRFRHLFSEKYKAEIEKIQKGVNERYERLLAKSAA